jgi:hypothetical protein
MRQETFLVHLPILERERGLDFKAELVKKEDLCVMEEEGLCSSGTDIK